MLSKPGDPRALDFKIFKERRVKLVFLILIGIFIPDTFYWYYSPWLFLISDELMMVVLVGQYVH